MNFPVGRVAFPMRERAANIDDGPITKNPPTGLVRGGTVEDYNVKARGLGMRIDKKPERPYP